MLSIAELSEQRVLKIDFATLPQSIAENPRNVLIFLTEESVMANLMRFDPFDDRFEDLLRGFFRPAAQQYAASNGSGVQIKVDVAEDEKTYTVHAEIPGVKKEDINVAIDGNQVSITAEIKREKEVKEGTRVLRSERYFGKAYRSFALGQEVDDGAAQARYADGVLELKLPKKAAQSARKLSIQ